MPAASPEADRQVFRPAAAVVLWWLWAAFALANLVDIAVQGRDHTAAVAAAAIVAITGAMYACALRPRVIADAGGITLVNPLREYRIPWEAVTAVDVGETLRIRCPRPGGGQEKVLHSWALQSSRRGQARAQLRSRRPAARAGGQPGYGRLPPEARELQRKSQAQLAAEALSARAQATQAAVPGDGQPAGAWAARWAWGPVAAVLVPVLVLVAVILA